jgi:hypothetical protein
MYGAMSLLTTEQEIRYLDVYEISTGNKAESEAGETADHINIPPFPKHKIK